MKQNALIILSFLIFTCTRSTAPDNQYTVSGYILYQGERISNVSVTMDTQNTLFSDNNGYFNFNAVSKGSHEIRIYKAVDLTRTSVGDDTSGFVERTINIQVNNDLTLDDLILPEPVYIFLGSIDSNIVVRWTQSRESSFREYKLFRHTSSGLDETTGELVHISTSVGDTTFIDDILDLVPERYFYRIYVMNEFGRLGGSNIVDTTIQETILDITINYTGQNTVSYLYRLFIGISQDPCYNECQDEGILVENNSTLTINIESYSEERRRIYGPFFISTFLDISGNHEGASLLPNDCPFVVYDGIDPVIAKTSCNSTPVYIDIGKTERITVDLTDDFLTNNYLP